MKIKSGYRITVESWENDADNYKTKTVDGLDEATARFHIDLLKLLYRKSKFSNMYDPSNSEIAKFSAEIERVVGEHNQTTEQLFDLYEYMEIITQYTGYSSQDYYTRVVESIVVEYVPQDIYLEDVSEKFGINKR